jgi:glycosyltransferase involved in cell wall biosynthesis
MYSSFSIVVTCHKEDNYLVDCLESVTRNIDFLQKFQTDLKYEVILVLDNANLQTSIIAENWAHKTLNSKTINANFKDVGFSRNLGIKHSKYENIFLLDGDDSWGTSWIFESLPLITSSLHQTIFHPELVIYKNDKIEFIRRHMSSSDEKFDPWVLTFENIWTSSILGSKSIFETTKFRGGSTLSDELYAYEDWSFHREVYGKGVMHSIVPKTVHIVNIREKSNTINSLSSNQFPRPSTEFMRVLMDKKYPL